MHIHKFFYIKTFKIAARCFDPKIMFSCNVKKTYVCALVGVVIKWLYEMHGATMKTVSAQQAKLNNCKNTKLKLLNSLRMILGSKHVGAILNVLM